MKFSVVVCTYGRPEYLSRTLDSLVKMQKPESVELEVIVVNNDCSERTTRVATEYSGQLPLTVISEQRAGLSYARNRGAAATTGDYVLWIDDDVLVDSHWLEAYEKATKTIPAPAIIGGTIIPKFDGESEPWMTDALPYIKSAYATRIGFSGCFDSSSEELPFGANFGVRGDLQRKVSYDVSLGRRPSGILIGGEEIALMRAILDNGGKGLWVPEAIIHHIIPAERQTIKYLRLYFEGQGYEHSWFAKHRGRKFKRFQKILLRNLYHELRFQLLFERSSANRWIHSFILAAKSRGELRFRWTVRRRRNAF